MPAGAWYPPGQEAPPSKWRYDMRKGWTPPGHGSNTDGTQFGIHSDHFDPADAPKGFHVLASPAGTAAPIDAVNYTPDTKEVHHPGSLAPVDKLNYSLIPSSRLARGGGSSQPAPMPNVGGMGVGQDTAGMEVGADWSRSNTGSPPASISGFPTQSLPNPAPQAGAVATQGPGPVMRGPAGQNPSMPSGNTALDWNGMGITGASIGAGAEGDSWDPESSNYDANDPYSDYTNDPQVPTVSSPGDAGYSDPNGAVADVGGPSQGPQPVAGQAGFSGRSQPDGQHVQEWANGKLTNSWTLKPGGDASIPADWVKDPAPKQAANGITYEAPTTHADGSVTQKGSNGRVIQIRGPQKPTAATGIKWGPQQTRPDGTRFQVGSNGEIRNLGAAPKGSTAVTYGQPVQGPDGGLWQIGSNGKWAPLEKPSAATQHWTREEREDGSTWETNDSTGEVRIVYGPTEPTKRQPITVGNRVLEYDPATKKYTEVYKGPPGHTLQNSNGRILAINDEDPTDVKTVYDDPLTRDQAQANLDDTRAQTAGRATTQQKDQLSMIPQPYSSGGNLFVPEGAQADVQNWDPMTGQTSQTSIGHHETVPDLLGRYGFNSPAQQQRSAGPQQPAAAGAPPPTADTSSVPSSDAGTGLPAPGVAGTANDPLLAADTAGWTPPPQPDFGAASINDPARGPSPAPPPDFAAASIDDPARGEPPVDDMGMGSGASRKKTTLQSDLQTDIPRYRQWKTKKAQRSRTFLGKGLDEFTPFVGSGAGGMTDETGQPWEGDVPGPGWRATTPEGRMSVGRAVAKNPGGVEPGVPFGAYEESETLPTDQDIRLSQDVMATPTRGMRPAPTGRPQLFNPSDTGPAYSWVDPHHQRPAPPVDLTDYPPENFGGQPTPRPYFDADPPPMSPSYDDTTQSAPQQGMDNYAPLWRRPAIGSGAGELTPPPMPGGTPPMPGGPPTPPGQGGPPPDPSAAGGPPPDASGAGGDPRIMMLIKILLGALQGGQGGAKAPPWMPPTGDQSPQGAGPTNAPGLPPAGMPGMPGAGADIAPPIKPQHAMGMGHKFGQPLDSGEEKHKGTDIQAPQGTPVWAPMDGTVRITNEPQGLGIRVIIQGADGKEHSLNHLSAVAVKDGMQVRKGQQIGKVGATGKTTGAHLDYRQQNPDGSFDNPEPDLGPIADKPPVPGTEMMGSGRSWTPPQRIGAGQGDESIPPPEGAESLSYLANQRQPVWDTPEHKQLPGSGNYYSLHAYDPGNPAQVVQRSQRPDDLPPFSRNPNAPDMGMGSGAGMGGMGAGGMRLANGKWSDALADTPQNQAQYGQGSGFSGASVGYSGPTAAGGGGGGGGGTNVSVDPATQARLKLDAQTAQWTHDFQTSQLQNQVQAENDRHAESLRSLELQAQQEADYRAVQDAVNAENTRHSQATEQLTRQQQALDLQLEQMREQQQTQERLGSQQFQTQQTGRGNAMSVLQSSLSNPWVQALTGLLPKGGQAGAQSSNGLNIQALLDAIFQGTGINATGGGTPGQSTSGQTQPLPTWQEWQQWSPFQKAAWRANIEAGGPGAFEQVQNQLMQQWGQQGGNADVTQLDAATQDQAGTAGNEMTANMFGSTAQDFISQQGKQWSKAQAPSIQQNTGTKPNTFQFAA